MTVIKKSLYILLAAVLFLTQLTAAAEETKDTDPMAWYKDAVVYEAFVRSFYDADGDGIGDIRGLTAKLDYLNDGDPKTDHDLEIGAIWLMPVFASPSYHGYDVTDYYTINPQYGSNKDFEVFLQEAHKRGIKIIIDLVVNHTSSKHPVFLEAKSSPSSPKRNWYVWRKDLPPGWGQPWSPHSRPNTVWHKAGDHYYYGIFYYGMPDLNYTNPQVRAEMNKIVKHWLKKGVDGYRLDAIRYLVEKGPKLGQMETEDTHNVMAQLYKTAKSVNPSALLVGEVWADMDTVASYFKSEISPAQVDSCFNFDLAGAIVDGVRNLNFLKIDVVLEIVMETYPAGAIDSIFLTNHDMDRIASITGPEIHKLKLAASVLLTFPGTPYIYYGEEIAMMGRKPDEMIRRPMRWNKEKFAGFTAAERPWIRPDAANPDYTVADMQKDKTSLLNHYKTFIRLRNRNIALRRGAYKKVPMTHPSVYGYLRTHEKQTLLVVHNFSADTVKLAAPPTLTVKKDLTAGIDATAPGSLKPFETKVFEVEATVKKNKKES